MSAYNGLIVVLFLSFNIVIGNIIEKNDVYEIDDVSFDAFIKSKDLVMVEFYAPWCGHCKKLEPGKLSLSKRQTFKTRLLLQKVDSKCCCRIETST